MQKLDDSEQFQLAVANAMRALSAKPELQVQYGSKQEVDAETVTLPRMPRNPEQLLSYRGIADALALRLRYHDASLHQQLSPSDGRISTLFDGLENARLCALGMNTHLGLRRNIAARLEARARLDATARAEASERVSSEALQQKLSSASEALAHETWLVQRLTGVQFTDATAELVQHLDDNIGEQTKSLVEQLQSQLNNQTEFAQTLSLLLQQLGLLDADTSAAEPSADNAQGADQDHAEGDAEAQQPDTEQLPEQSADLGADTPPDGLSEQMQEVESEDDEETQWEGQDSWLEDKYADELHRGYQVYTTAHDQIVSAESLCDHEQMQQLRKYLDEMVRPLQPLVARLANKLQRLLLAQQRRRWDFETEDGILNSARLVRVVTDPGAQLPFKRELDHPFKDTVFSLLIDCSGSMRGRSMMVAAMCADVMGSTLERCGVRTEILGFTTGEWKGGQTRTDWEAAGKPDYPGRLNDLLHIVYKPANASWRRCRKNLGLMMREGLLKENIDGEALLWAHDRLMQQQCDRRVLMVISDGAPVDDATLTCNGSKFLERHLHQVIGTIEQRSPVELVAIGIGHDVRRYYKNAVMVASPEDLGKAMASELSELFAKDV